MYMYIIYYSRIYLKIFIFEINKVILYKIQKYVVVYHYAILIIMVTYKQ